MTITSVFWTIIWFGLAIIFCILAPQIFKLFKEFFRKTNYNALGESSKIRLVRQLDDAVKELSLQKIGAIITVRNKDRLDNFRTDGVKIDANISSSLILAIFEKKSPLHDGAIVIDNNRITYASTYYKITSRSLENRYGARHRAALGISEQTDALTIVVSEENGNVSFSKNSEIFQIKRNEFQEKLTEYLK